MAVLGLCFCARAFDSCGKRGPLLIAVRGPLIIAASLVAASLVAEHRLQTRRLSNCGSRAQLLRGMCDPSRSRARTRVPCIGRQIPNHCATREALYIPFDKAVSLLGLYPRAVILKEWSMNISRSLIFSGVCEDKTIFIIKLTCYLPFSLC